MTDTSLINFREVRVKEALVTHNKEVVEVTSEKEDTEASKVALTCQTVLSSKGSINKRVACSLLNAKTTKQTKTLY